MISIDGGLVLLCVFFLSRLLVCDPQFLCSCCLFCGGRELMIAAVHLLVALHFPALMRVALHTILLLIGVACVCVGAHVLTVKCARNAVFLPRFVEVGIVDALSY